MSSIRWKYPEAKQVALDNPISDVYRQMQSMPPLRSIFNQISVILRADKTQSELLNSFCIGHPILVGPKALLSCGSAPEGQEEGAEAESLLYELAFEEAFFLSYELKCLQVFHQEGFLNDESLWQLISLHKHGFPYYYKAYSHLRRKNWIVRTGLQYGVHYVAYRHHPSHVHAEYSVVVVPDWEKQTQLSSWSHIQGIVRLCGNVAKTLLLLHVEREDHGNDHDPSCLAIYSINEMQVKRWLPQKHRMDTCVTTSVSL